MKERQYRKCAKRLQTPLSEYLESEVNKAIKVINNSPASRGFPVKFSEGSRLLLELGAGVAQLFGDGFVSPQHAIEQIKKAMEVN